MKDALDFGCKLHDATVESIELNGRILELKIETFEENLSLKMATTTSWILDCSEDWGPSKSILEFTFHAGKLDMQLQSGVKISSDNATVVCETTEVRTTSDLNSAQGAK